LRRLSDLIIAVSVRRPFWVVAVLLPLVVLAAIGVTRINYVSGLRSLFASESREFTDYAKLTHRFAEREADIIVLATAPDGFDGATLKGLRDFVLDAQFLDGVESIYSVFSLRAKDAKAGKPGPLLPNDLENAAKVSKGLQAATGVSAAGFSIMSRNQKETVVVLSPRISVVKGGQSAVLLHQLEALLKEKQGKVAGLRFGITGVLPARERIVAGLRLDQMQMNLIGAILGFFVSLIMFRSFWVAVLNTVTPLVALLFCLGIFGWLGLSVNALTNVLPILILVLASSDTIHITYDIRRRLGAGEASLNAIRSAVTDIAPPCVLTSLTTMLAFASLFYSESPIIRDLALSGTIGVFIALVAVLFVHPLVFVIADRIAFIRRALPLNAIRQRGTLPDAVFRAVGKRFKIISVGGIALCLLLLWILLPIQTSYRFMENIDNNDPIATVMKRVEEISGPLTTASIPFSLADGVAPTDKGVIADLKRIHGVLAPLQGVRAVLSVASLVPDNNGLSISDQFQELPANLKNMLVGPKGKNLQLLLLVPDRGSQATNALAKKITDVLSDLKLEHLNIGRPTGFLVMASALADRMIRQLSISFLIASLVCPVLIGFWFRSLAFGLAAIVPNILPIAATGAVLTLMGNDIQFTSALALTISFGIALDDSIHVFNRIELKRRADSTGEAQNTIVTAMAEVAPVLITTTIILSAGLLSTQISAMPMIRFFGVLCVLTFLVALLCDLFLLPALVAWKPRRGKVAQ